MPSDWQNLTSLTRGRPLVVERVRLVGSDISIEGEFGLPPLAQLTMEDQAFVMAFVREHGSIKQMEAQFGISYPTVKNRLNQVSERLEEYESRAASNGEDEQEVRPAEEREEVLRLLERGKITAREAARSPHRPRETGRPPSRCRNRSREAGVAAAMIASTGGGTEADWFGSGAVSSHTRAISWKYCSGGNMADCIFFA